LWFSSVLHLKAAAASEEYFASIFRVKVKAKQETSMKQAANAAKVRKFHVTADKFGVDRTCI
jgi:hypothetical protein